MRARHIKESVECSPNRRNRKFLLNALSCRSAQPSTEVRIFAEPFDCGSDSCRIILGHQHTTGPLAALQNVRKALGISRYDW